MSDAPVIVGSAGSCSAGRGCGDMNGISDSADPGYGIGTVLAFLIVFVVLASVLGAGVLVLMVSWHVAFGPRRPRSAPNPSPGGPVPPRIRGKILR
jgi:hypothetical protein